MKANLSFICLLLFCQSNQISTQNKSSYEIIATYPHEIQTFTQGLFCEDGVIYESSGGYGNSFLAKYKLSASDYLVKKDVDEMYYTEGITKHDDKIYQLTWKEKTVLVYDFETLELINKIDFPMLKESWGICSNGEQLIVSDGTQYLYFIEINDDKLEIAKQLEVVGSDKIYENINELEYIDNRVYANILWKNIIIVINPETGIVEFTLDLTELKGNRSQQQVLNGIAKIDNKTLLITGKHWDKMYKIELK